MIERMNVAALMAVALLLLFGFAYLKPLVSVPAPPLPQGSNQTGRILFQRGSAHHVVASLDLLCRVPHDAFEVPHRFPAVGTRSVPRGEHDLEHRVLVQ